MTGGQGLVLQPHDSTILYPHFSSCQETMFLNIILCSLDRIGTATFTMLGLMFCVAVETHEIAMGSEVLCRIFSMRRRTQEPFLLSPLRRYTRRLPVVAPSPLRG